MTRESIKIKEVTITHPDKVLFPSSGITKLDIVNYYIKVEKRILPYLKLRPVSLVRAPNGINNIKFVQKHPSESFPEYIERIKLKESEGSNYYILIDEISDLLYLINIGVLEFHTSNSLITDYEHPDQMIFDLDPDEKLELKYTYQCAFDLKELMENQGYKPIIKTSGGKGFHIIIKMNEKMTWDEVHKHSKELVHELSAKNEMYIDTISKKSRQGKIFIDYLRNSRGGTTVSTYSTRAKEDAPISMPINWSDLEKIKPNQFNINNFK